ncbi:MAG TPA: TetR/AcrR family transcriptional regulator [Dinghuibacter sp.]|uniref:TetR/AcrR family transcriptional regulator n=1 Tax=Dinghuibacter sp. TaxID=2024697 RepID=UPI002C95CFAD|nr:TetR/AcrR family transcriptional regulator [Dinghuibacter sp.]HTJ14167.1 TetR/AcrR family transcriptional regulator [Dinghuibacter sp.]
MRPNPGDAHLDTRTKILSLADDLVRKKGFNAFSYKDISDSLAIKPAAIHYYFPTKEDLGVAILRQEIERFERNGERWQHESPVTQLQNLIGLFRVYWDRGQICLMGSLCPDKNTLPEKMQVQLEKLCGLILDWVADILEQGTFKQGKEFAPVIMATLMSSVILARVQGAGVFNTIIAQLQKDLI